MSLINCSQFSLRFCSEEKLMYILDDKYVGVYTLPTSSFSQIMGMNLDYSVFAYISLI